jgi:1-phosphatidylinositol-4-phosphate 5-kinase
LFLRRFVRGSHAYSFSFPPLSDSLQNVLISYGAVVHERYDLKGSWINRRLVKPEYGQRIACRHCGQRFRFGGPREQNQCPARPNHSHEANTVMRDTDWVYKLRLGPHQSDALIQVINADTEFLRSQGIMDYSLLLGIHRSRYRLMHAEEFDDVGRHTPSAAGNAASESKASQVTTATAPVPGLILNRAEPMSPDAKKAMAPAPQQWGIDWGSQSRDAISSASPIRLAYNPSDTASAADSTGIAAVDEISRGGNPIVYHEEAGTAKKFQAPTLQPSIFTAHRGGLRAAVVEGPGVYYMGIIDVLQRWTLAKRIENFFKTRLLFKDTRGLSAIAPNAYATRFRSRVIGQLIEIPE